MLSLASVVRGSSLTLLKAVSRIRYSGGSTRVRRALRFAKYQLLRRRKTRGKLSVHEVFSALVLGCNSVATFRGGSSGRVQGVRPPPPPSGGILPKEIQILYWC